MNSLFKKSIPHLIAGFIFLFISATYFLPQLQNKVVKQSDIVNFKGMSQEAKAYFEKTGEAALWTNSMFGGMPTYQISSPQRNNLMRYVDRVTNLFLARPIGYFFYGMLMFYIMMVCLGVNSWLSMIGAIAFGLASNNMVLFETGHTSKVRVIFYLAPILAGIVLTFKKKYIAGFVLFTTGLALSLYCNHPQMVYYLFMMLLIYGVMQLVVSLKANELAHFAKATAILLGGVALAVGASASKILTTYEYAQDTMRGDPILKSESTTPKSSSETSGLEYSYWGNWSNGTMDLFAGIIPRVVGGASGEKVGKGTNISKFFRGNKMPMYWGKLPGTSGPVYYGAIICFLFLLGAMLVKGNLKWWLVIAVVLTMLMSFGSNLGVNKLLFEYFPMYNKFRAPSSILSITTFLVPILSILGLSAFLYGKATQKEKLFALYVAGGVSAAICLFFALAGPSFFDFSSPGDARYQRADIMQALVADRKALMTGDAWRSFALIIAAIGALWAFAKEKIQWIPALAIIGILVTGDLWTVGKRYLGEDAFVAKRVYSNSFNPRPVDKQILKDKDLSYRVYDASVNTFNNAIVSYHHKTIGGYHAAKLQRYQDIVVRHISKNNQAVLNMLNTKYFITGQPGKEQVQQNPGALGNAWFVSKVKSVANPNEEIDALTGLNPIDEAVVHNEFADYTAGLNLQKNGSIQLTTYSPNALTYSSNSSSEQLAVFSEVWYGPNKGWNAYIDGKLVEHIRANYLLRALKVPAGNHKIEFKFEPKIFKTGEMISLICSLLILLGLLGFIGKSLRDKMNEPETLDQELDLAGQPKVKPTVSKTNRKKSKNKKKKS